MGSPRPRTPRATVGTRWTGRESPPRPNPPQGRKIPELRLSRNSPCGRDAHPRLGRVWAIPWCGRGAAAGGAASGAASGAAASGAASGAARGAARGAASGAARGAASGAARGAGVEPPVEQEWSRRIYRTLAGVVLSKIRHRADARTRPDRRPAGKNERAATARGNIRSPHSRRKCRRFSISLPGRVDDRFATGERAACATPRRRNRPR
jgi:hypothetical protein